MCYQILSFYFFQTDELMFDILLIFLYASKCFYTRLSRAFINLVNVDIYFIQLICGIKKKTIISEFNFFKHFRTLTLKYFKNFHSRKTMTRNTTFCCTMFNNNSFNFSRINRQADNEMLGMEEVEMPEEEQLHELSFAEKTMWVIMYCVVAFLAVFGNSLVIYVVFTSKK